MNTAMQALWFAAALVAAVVSGNVQAQTDLSTTGTADCFAHAPAGRNVLQMGSNAVSTLFAGGPTINVTGPNSPNNDDSESGGPESATVRGLNGSPGTRLAFAGSSIRILFAVFKAGDNVVVRYYGDSGVYDDASGFQIFNVEFAAPIETLNLCYEAPFGPATPVAAIPSCPPSQCSGTNPQLMCSIDLDAAYFSDGTNACCACNQGALPQCNPAALGGQPGSCLGDGTGSKVGLELPTYLEFNKDPYVCSIVGGKRTCYMY